MAKEEADEAVSADDNESTTARMGASLGGSECGTSVRCVPNGLIGEVDVDTSAGATTATAAAVIADTPSGLESRQRARASARALIDS